MPIWGEHGPTWRQILPPVLVALAIACLAYAVGSCYQRRGEEFVRHSIYLDHYLDLLASPDPASRAAGARLLGELGDRDAIAPLRKLLEDPDPRVVGAACAALGAAGDQECSAALLQRLDNAQPAVVAGAAEGLGALGYKEAAPRLVTLLDAGDLQVRLAAVVALGRLGDTVAVERLRALKADSYRGLAQAPADEDAARLQAAIDEALGKLAPRP